MKKTLKKVIATSTALTLIIGGTVFATGQDSDDRYEIKQATESNISLERAKEIALKDADLDLTKVKFKEAELGEDDDTKQYELEFVSDKVEYEYDIRLSDGKILDKESDQDNKEDDVDDMNDDQDDKYDDAYDMDDDQDDEYDDADDMDDDQDDKETNVEDKDLIGVERAKEISIKHVGLTSDQVNFESVELDIDDGKKIYEVEFKNGNKEYEFEIDAKTGQIIEFDSEIDD